MATLLSLPAELRHAIWAFVPSDSAHITLGHLRPTGGETTSSEGAYKSLCLTCKALNAEATLILYRRIQLSLQHPNEVLQWVASIGSRNSSCVENLVLNTSQLVAIEDAQTWANESAWALALRSMPKLQTFSIHFAREPQSRSVTSLGTDVTLPNPSLLQMLSISAFETTKLASSVSSISASNSWRFQPSIRQHQFTHAFISLDEPMPPVLAQYFNTTARSGQIIKSPKSDGLSRMAMETNITGLPSTFFEQNDFRLTHTSAFNCNNENANAILTFVRKPERSDAPDELARGMMRDLPNLAYLRLGCHRLNSSILMFVPRHLHTLDVAFTDNDANRVADNLMTMRGICKKLFTLAIAVSPLHDRGSEDNDAEETFFDRALVTQEDLEKWAPFWQALDDIKASKVKIWEGEGPGYRKQSVR